MPLQPFRNITSSPSPTNGDVDIGFVYPSGTIIQHIAVNTDPNTASGPLYAVIFIGDPQMAMVLKSGWISTPLAATVGVNDTVLNSLAWYGAIELAGWAGTGQAPNVGAFVRNDTGTNVSVQFGVSGLKP